LAYSRYVADDQGRAEIPALDLQLWLIPHVLSFFVVPLVNGQERRWLLVSFCRCGKPLARGFAYHIREESASESAASALYMVQAKSLRGHKRQRALERFRSPGQMVCHILGKESLETGVIVGWRQTWLNAGARGLSICANRSTLTGVCF